ncbi:MAG: family 78 glycoside hydrolase catalytic domain [Eubacteriales bacterium]
MKKGFFITCRDFPGVKHDHPWQKEGQLFNAREYELPKEEGLISFRKVFSLRQKVHRATICATALGIFDMYLNGERIGENTPDGKIYDELKPGWTDYRMRVFEFTYDITDMIKEENTFIASVAPGWWSGRISHSIYGMKNPAFCGEIEIEYDDGTKELIASDESFESAIAGPVLFADIWDGEYYDARKKWSSCEPDWQSAVKFDGFTGKIVSHIGPTVRMRSFLNRRPCSAITYRGTDDDGSDFGKLHITGKRVGNDCEKMILSAGNGLILDMGQDMVGRPKIELKAPRGTKIDIYFSEFLNDSGKEERGCDGPCGSLYIKNYRSALSRIVYIASGEGTEVYYPTFTFFGFRYLEIKADSDIELINLTGEVIGSDITETSSIETSNAEVNKLISNIIWGHRSNYLSIPTDCPQRDERLGWSGDTQIFCGAASYQMDIDGFMRKWLQDARDSQIDHDGVYACVIPRIWFGSKKGGDGGWSDAGIIVPYRMYLMYNDTELIREHYDSMEWYMDSIEKKTGIKGPYAKFGDWLSYEETDKDYISVCYYIYDATLMEIMSRAIGKTERAEYYRGLRAKIIEYFNSLYLEENDLKIKTQTSYLLALAFGIVSGKVRENCIEQLKNKIIDNNYTLSTGFLGTGILNQTLSEVGLDELCYSLLLQTNDPSWLYSVRQGATTVWERWNSYTSEKGFGNVKMNSFNHYAYGAVIEWMYSKMAGISPDPENPGFSHFILCPRPDTRKSFNIPKGQERITYVKARYDSVKGTIRSEWEYENGKFVYHAEIPEGTSARVEFPLPSNDYSVTINGITFSMEELKAVKKDRKLIFELSAGKYTIS